jgi:hypothetical protein
MKKKKQLRDMVRKKRREAHERNLLSRRARGLPSRSVIRRFVGQRADANRIWSLTEKILRFLKRERKLRSSRVRQRIIPAWKVTKRRDGRTLTMMKRMMRTEIVIIVMALMNKKTQNVGGDEEMEYDDASVEITEVPRKWGKWFDSVRKDDEEDEEFF